MCRMLAALTARPQSFADRLLDAPNCLLKQCGGDRRGERHFDGWGIGWYEAGVPQRVRAPTSAITDARFAELARQLTSRAIVAHVRQASVGSLTIENCHPFQSGSWLFAHNGTIERFETVQTRMMAEMDHESRRLVEGSTDSEWLFRWLLARGKRAGIDWSTVSAAAPEVVELVSDGLRDVARWSAAAPKLVAVAEMAVSGAAVNEAAVHRHIETKAAVGEQPAVYTPPERLAKHASTGDEPTRLNVFLTNGSSLLATRWKYDLHYAVTEQGVFVASEPIDTLSNSAPQGAGSWRELPEPSILTVSADLRPVVHSLAS